MLAEGNVRTHCFPGAHVLDVSAQIPAILKGDESVAAVVIVVSLIHSATNWQQEIVILYSPDLLHPSSE